MYPVDRLRRACRAHEPANVLLWILEAGGRYVAFMAKVGRRQDAGVGMAEIERRQQKISPPLRGEARIWRDLAAKALGRG